jgi:hypothetical protein
MDSLGVVLNGYKSACFAFIATFNSIWLGFPYFKKRSLKCDLMGVIRVSSHYSCRYQA